MGFIVDRIEGEVAVLLMGETVQEIGKDRLAEGITEGDAVFLGEDGIWRKDAAETENRKTRIEKKMNALWE